MKTNLNQNSGYIYDSDFYLNEIHQQQLGVKEGATTIVGGEAFDGSVNAHNPIEPKNNGLDNDYDSCKMVIQNNSSGDENIVINSNPSSSTVGLELNAGENYIRDKQLSDNGELYIHFPQSSGSARVTYIA